MKSNDLYTLFDSHDFARSDIDVRVCRFEVVFKAHPLDNGFGDLFVESLDKLGTLTSETIESLFDDAINTILQSLDKSRNLFASENLVEHLDLFTSGLILLFELFGVVGFPRTTKAGEDRYCCHRASSSMN